MGSLLQHIILDLGLRRFKCPFFTVSPKLLGMESSLPREKGKLYRSFFPIYCEPICNGKEGFVAIPQICRLWFILLSFLCGLAIKGFLFICEFCEFDFKMKRYARKHKWPIKHTNEHILCVFTLYQQQSHKNFIVQLKWERLWPRALFWKIDYPHSNLISLWIFSNY